MPVVLQPADLAAWLTGSEDVAHRAIDRALTSGYTAEPVSRLVNTPQHDSAELLNPVTLAHPQPLQQTLL